MRIYFSGIGGGGIGPLAMIADDAGFEVLGSDMKSSEVFKLLQERGLELLDNGDGSFLKAKHEESPIDLFVYTSALPTDHPELLYAKEVGIQTAKRHELINLILKRKGLKMLAVAGTHGKTTTSGLLAWIFEKLEIPYSHSVGSTLSFAPAGRYQQGSEYFVYEADEFDRNFLQFESFISLVTSIGYDHADTYPDQHSYDDAFVEFISKSKTAILWDKDTARFNVGSNAKITVLDDYEHRNHEYPNYLGITLPGIHNRANASLVAELAVKHLGLPIQKVIDTINEFPGTDRRFERLTSTLYTDFAHHPDEIKATIQMASELNDNVIVVYQPHQNIRQHTLLKEDSYKDVFNGVEKVYWLPTFLSREYLDLETLPPETLAKTANIENLEIAKLDEKLVANISKHLVEGYLVVGMSAGDLDQFLRKSYKDYQKEN